MPQQYTVKNNETGQTVTFDWHDANPPTDADMEEVFAAARSVSAEKPAEHPHARVARLVGENLPAIGGAIGGALGAVGGPVVAAGTAALGGAAGRAGQKVVEGIRRITQPRNLPSLVTGEQPQESTGAMLGDIATEGAIQGGLQAAGGLAGKGLSAGARRLYQGLAKPAKALRQEFPTLVQDALESRVPLTQRGGAKAERLVSKSHDAAEAVIDAAAPTARPVQGREIVSEFGDTVKKLRKDIEIGLPSEMRAVGERGRRIVGVNRAGVPLKRAQELKRQAQDRAQAAYKARDIGAKENLSVEDMLNEDVARGFRKAIEQRAPVADINTQTQKLLGVDRMVSDATSREGNTLALNGLRDLAAIGGGAGLGSLAGAPGAGAAGGLLLKLLSTPSTGSHAAILANDAARMGLPTHVLRALMASVRTGAPGAEE